LISIKYIALILFISSGNLFPQSSNEWIKSYGSGANSYDEGIDIVADIYGNIYVAGNSIRNKRSDILLLKYNPGGDLIWSRTFDEFTGNDVATDMDIGSDGCVCIAGYSDNSIFNPEFVTIKYDPAGNLLWAKRYSYPGYAGAMATALDIDNENSVYVTGVLQNFNSKNFTIKYTSQGDTVWTSFRYLGLYGYNPVTINVDKQKNVYCATGDYYTEVHRFDSSGIKRQGAQNSYGNVLSKNGSVLAENALYVVGNNLSFFEGSPQYFFQKYRPDNYGPVQQRGYFCLGLVNRFDSAKAVALGLAENVFVTGKSCDSISCFISTVKLDSNFTIKWESVYRTNTNFYSGGNAIVMEKNGYNMYMTGANDNYLTIKYKHTNGDTMWVRQYNGVGNGIDVSNAIAIDSSGNVIITGRSQVSGNDYDIVTIKYYQTSGINSNQSYTPSQFLLMQNYPNPFNPITFIKYLVPSKNLISLIIYDARGIEVRKLINSVQSAGLHDVTFDGSDLPSGIYFCSLFANDVLIDSKKLILLK